MLLGSAAVAIRTSRVYLCWYSRWYSDNAAYTARHYTRYLRGDALKHERHEQILHDDFDRRLCALLKRVKFYGVAQLRKIFDDNMMFNEICERLIPLKTLKIKLTKKTKGLFFQKKNKHFC